MKGKIYILIFFALLVVLVLSFYMFSISLGAVKVDAVMADDKTVRLGFTHSRSNDVLANQPVCISVIGNVVHGLKSCTMTREKFAQSIIDNVPPGKGKCGFVPEKDKDWYCKAGHECFDYNGYTFAGDCVDGQTFKYCDNFKKDYCAEFGLAYSDTAPMCQSSFGILSNYEIYDSHFKVNGYSLKDLTFDGNEVCAVSDFEILRPLNIEISYKFREPIPCPLITGFKIEDKKCIEASGCDVVYDTERDCKIKLWYGLISTFVVNNILWIILAKLIIGTILAIWVFKK